MWQLEGRGMALIFLELIFYMMMGIADTYHTILLYIMEEEKCIFATKLAS
jgi:hypothetical protein